MKLHKKITLICLITHVMMSFSQCTSTQKLEKSVPITFGDVYYQNRVSDVQESGKSFNIFIPIVSNPNKMILDSVFFKGKQAKLEFKNDNVFIGCFKSKINQKQDLIMSNEPYAEYENKVPNLPQKTPFKLNEDECVVSYTVGNKLKYFKIENIARRESKKHQ